MNLPERLFWLAAHGAALCVGCVVVLCLGCSGAPTATVTEPWTIDTASNEAAQRGGGE